MARSLHLKLNFMHVHMKIRHISVTLKITDIAPETEQKATGSKEILAERRYEIHRLYIKIEIEQTINC